MARGAYKCRNPPGQCQSAGFGQVKSCSEKEGGHAMQRSHLTHWRLVALTILSLTLLLTPAGAELKPGDRLDKTNCQEAKGLLPEHVMEKFCDGKYASEIIEVKDEAYQYSKKFSAGSEANAGKYYVTDDGYMYETATKTWPHFWYGFPFPQIDDKDPKAAYKVVYNLQI